MSRSIRKYELRFILLAILSILAFWRVYGKIDDRTRFNHLVSPNYELRSNAITSIVQDDVGTIWMGSRKGLFIYNGNDYKEVKHVNQYLKSTFKQDIYVLHFDARGWLWIGTQKGLVVYDPKSAHIKLLPGFIAKDNNIVNGISSTKNGDVIIAMQYKLFAYIASENTYKDITPPIQRIETNRTLRFYSICEIDSSLWVSTLFGLYQLKQRAGKYEFSDFFDFKDLYSGSIVKHRNIRLIENGAGELIVGTLDKLFKFDFENGMLKPYRDEDNDFIGKRFRALALDKENRLWIGTMSGILIDDPNGIISVSYNPEQSNSLSDDRIRALFVDRNNTIWVGTYFGGVNYWNDRNVKFFHISDKTKRGLADKTVNCIAEDNNGIIYYGTEKSEVTTYNSFTGEYSNLKNIGKHGASPVTYIYPENNNKIWLCRDRDGLVCYNSQTQEQKVYMPNLERSAKMLDSRIISIVKESDTLYWVSIKFKGLCKFNPNTGIFQQVKPTENHDQISIISHMEKDHLGNLWCATPGRLFVLNNDSIKQKRYHFREVLTEKGSELNVNDIYLDKNNNVWVAGENNVLLKYTPAGVIKIDIGENVSMFSIVAGEGDDLWLSSSIGVIQLDTQTNDFKVFDSRHGLHMNAFCDGAGIRASNGNIYFGGTSGITYFNPSTSSDEAFDTSNNVIITDLLVYNKPVEVGDYSGILSQSIEYTDQLTLHYKQNMFAIKFAHADFGYTARYNFEYRLRGLSDEWIQTTNPMVAYTLQTGGDYVFEVRHLTPEGIPVSQIKRLYITLKNPFWKTGWAYAFYAGIVLLGFGSVFYLYRSRMKLNFQLQMELVDSAHRKQVHQHKLNFFTNISHDFRTPLTLIIGAVDQFISKYSLSHEMCRTLSSVQKNTNQLLRLLNDLMDFRKIESKQMRLKVNEDNIVDFVREIFLSFKIQADNKKIAYEFTSSDEEILAYFDSSKMERVIYNLLSNAFKFTEEAGKITISLVQKNNTIEIAIKDSGCGIALENQQYVFERFYEENNPNNLYNRGTGIGLSISKSIVELHKGTISFHSVQDVGTTFVISLWKGSTHFSENDITNEKVDRYISRQVLSGENVEKNRKLESIIEDTWRTSNNDYSILIAEDNEELGLYLKESLSAYFNVTLAENGKTAFKSVLNDPPDLIISDVMMPEMDGIEFCEKIKTTTETSHIPFVMLTARTALVYKYEGLEAGADEYLSKPFHLKELVLKCFNVLKTQDNLRQRFLHDDDASFAQPIQNTSDKDLYNKAMQILNKNVGNNLFGIEDLSEQLGLSRSVLFVKIKEWTDQSPGELLMGFRMKHAASLLEQDRYTIAQIAEIVGFNHASYFSKCFKNYHKLTPTEYVKKLR